MLRYVAGSAISKAFSLSPVAERSYRVLGNGFETWRRCREGLADRYVERARRLISSINGYVELDASSSILEVGTGYVHWESLVSSLVSDARPTLFDVVDNRLFPVFQLYASELVPLLDTLGLPSGRMPAAQAILDTVRDALTFDEVYEKLSWKYVLDDTGTMTGIADNSVDLVISADVLEHVNRDIMDLFLNQMYKVLTPGGVAYHAIDLSDHLSNFDPKAPSKVYYRFAGHTWDRWFNSKVQYINRIQAPEWLGAFEKAGFEILSEERISEPHGVEKVHPSYSYLTQPEKDTKSLLVVLRKPILIDAAAPVAAAPVEGVLGGA